MKENKKKCRTCEVEKSLDEYYKTSGGKKIDSDCKNCRKEKVREYQEKNKEEISKKKNERYYANHEENRKKLMDNYYKNHDKNLKKRKKYRQKNKEKLAQKDKEYRERNKERLHKRRRERHLQIKNKECTVCHKIGDHTDFCIGQAICKDCQSNYYKQYRGDNKEAILKTKRKYQNKRLKTDPQFRLNRIISGGIRHSLENGKDGRHWEDIVGYTITELKNHLESLWEPWMNWENHGPYDPSGPKTWQIDHIIPKSMFDFKSYEDEEFKLCWSLRNLQPKCSKMNNLKRDRYIG